MRSAVRRLLAAAFAIAVLIMAACGSTTTSSRSTSPSPNDQSSRSTPTPGSGSPRSGGGQLDPEVSMPSGFPSDFPIYGGARLTSQGSFTTSGKTSWAVKWETVDSVDRVKTFFDAMLNKDPWTVSFSGTTNGSYSAVFARKDNSSYGGLLGVDSTTKTGVTTITLILGTS